MLVPLFAVPVALMLVAAEAAVPNFNVTPSCRGAVEAGYIGEEANRMQICLDSEKRTRDKLELNWTTFPAGDRDFCISSIKYFSPTYTELATCLEMRRDLKKTAPPADSAPVRVPGGTHRQPMSKP